MLQRYSVRLRIYSWFMKYCHPKLASAGVIAAFPVVTSVGANTHLGVDLLCIFLVFTCVFSLFQMWVPADDNSSKLEEMISHKPYIYV